MLHSLTQVGPQFMLASMLILSKYVSFKNYHKTYYSRLEFCLFASPIPYSIDLFVLIFIY